MSIYALDVKVRIMDSDRKNKHDPDVLLHPNSDSKWQFVLNKSIYISKLVFM